jgi:hypothetical protein
MNEFLILFLEAMARAEHLAPLLIESGIEISSICIFPDKTLKVGTNENGSACGRWLLIGI